MHYLFSGFGYLIGGVLCLAFGMLSVALLASKAEGGKRNKTIFDYLFIWPLLIDEYRNRSSKKSNVFVVVGVILMIALIAFGVATGDRGRH